MFIIIMAPSNLLTFCSYNMFGFRNGLSMLNDLCCKHSVVAVQEHWLREDELDKFNLIHEDYNFYAASGMNCAIANAILKGRPFGRVGFFWHKSLNGAMEPVGYSPDGRCIVLKLSVNNYTFMLFNVYFPCFENTAVYKTISVY